MYDTSLMKMLPILKFGLDNKYITTRSILKKRNGFSDNYTYIIKNYINSLVEKYNIEGTFNKNRDSGWSFKTNTDGSYYGEYFNRTSNIALSNFNSLIKNNDMEDLADSAKTWKFMFNMIRRDLNRYYTLNSSTICYVALPNKLTSEYRDGIHYLEYLTTIEAYIKFLGKVIENFREVTI